MRSSPTITTKAIWPGWTSKIRSSTSSSRRTKRISTTSWRENLLRRRGHDPQWAESQKLAMYKEYAPDIQEALHFRTRINHRARPSDADGSDGCALRGGDLRHGYQAVADNLAERSKNSSGEGNEENLLQEFMDARVNYVVLPIGKMLMRQDQANLASDEGYLAVVVMHEIRTGSARRTRASMASRWTFARRSVRSTVGSKRRKRISSGLYGLDWLMNKGVMPKVARGGLLRVACRWNFPHGAIRCCRGAWRRRR